MIVVQGEARFHPEDMAQVREATPAMIQATRAEAGCIAYAYAEDFLEPGLVRIVERWESEPEMKAHLTSPHMAAFAAVLGKVRVLGMRVVAYDATGERIIFGR